MLFELQHTPSTPYILQMWPSRKDAPREQGFGISTKAGNSSTNGYGHVTLHGYSSAGINNVPGPSFFFKTLRQTEIINRLK
jgi:hypothetical protein